MNLEKILAISGKPGLYALKVQTRTGFVAESFIDGKRITVGMKSNVSLLSEISVYTYDAEKPLVDVMTAIAVKQNCEQSISDKESNDVLETYFKEVLPDYDQERVYASDIKKILKWYNTLQAKGLITLEEPILEDAEAIKEAVVEEVKKAPAKKAKAKKE
ncbi:MAG: DUF5606 domain-containing protein [Flavobacterium sp.]|nr:DUF5606 domain-containing protein [Flavobacterium sp.]